MKTIITLLVFLITINIYSQNQVLLNESWFVQAGKNSSTSTSWDNILNTNPEIRTEIAFLNDKMVVQDCCGGAFEMDVNYVSNNQIVFLNLTEIQNPNCSSLGVYSNVKDIFSSMVNETITFTIQNNPFESGIKDIVFNHPSNSNFIEFSNTPNEINDQAQSPYWGHEPPTHIWSLTQVQYQGQTFDLPYGAAPTVADIYEGTFTISLCGEIFVGINFSWELDVEVYEGPCFISCGILQNTADACDPVSGYNANYLEDFKQHVFDFLNDNINQTMEYTFTLGSARKLIIEDFSQNKLIFHSNNTYLSTSENSLAPAITIYPNPAHDFINIDTSFCNSCLVKMYSPNGKLLYSESIQRTHKIDLKQLSNGVYFLVVENEMGIKQTEKFVKK
ncbi:MAG: T9SS type A sorting domain-containing protein [Flavobacteriaceae bacterium]